MCCPHWSPPSGDFAPGPAHLLPVGGEGELAAETGVWEQGSPPPQETGSMMPPVLLSRGASFPPLHCPGRLLKIRQEDGALPACLGERGNVNCLPSNTKPPSQAGVEAGDEMELSREAEDLGSRQLRTWLQVSVCMSCLWSATLGPALCCYSPPCPSCLSQAGTWWALSKSLLHRWMSKWF